MTSVVLSCSHILPCLLCHVLAIKFCPMCLSQLFCLSYAVLAVIFCPPVHAVLSRLSCSDCPVPTITSQFSCLFFCPVLAVMFRLSIRFQLFWPSCPVSAVRSQLSGPSFPVFSYAVLVLPCPLCAVLSVRPLLSYPVVRTNCPSWLFCSHYPVLSFCPRCPVSNSAE